MSHDLTEFIQANSLQRRNTGSTRDTRESEIMSLNTDEEMKQ